MKGVADRTLELMNEYQADNKSWQSFQHFLVVKIETLEDENEALVRAITDGRLTHIHFRTWADALVESQGYSGSEIEWLCSRLANALLKESD